MTEYSYYFIIKDNCDKPTYVDITLMRCERNKSILFDYHNSSSDVMLHRKTYILKTKDEIEHTVQDMKNNLDNYESSYEIAKENERKSILAEQNRREGVNRLIESLHKKPFTK